MIDIDLKQRLKQAGIKHTKQRWAILDIMQRSNQPVTVDQIYSALIQKKLNMSLSTVYRFLYLLSEKELVTKISIIQEDRHLYEINDGFHRHYLYCLGCEKIMAIKYCPLEDYEKSLADDTGYSIIGHKLSVYGYCPECKRKKKT